MSDFERAKVKVFRLAAPRVFIFLVGVGYPVYIGSMLVRYGLRMDWRLFMLGAAAMFPTALFLAGAVSLVCPAVRLTAEGIHAQSVWGLPTFVRWQDIEEVRPFDFLNLRWLRVYSRADSIVTWLAVFQSPAEEFKQEMQRLAPTGCPVLDYFE